MRRLATAAAVLVLVAGTACQSIPQDTRTHVANAHGVYNAMVAAYLKLDDAKLVPADIKAAFMKAEQYAYKILKVADAAVTTGQEFNTASLDEALTALQDVLNVITEVALGSG